ncbi:MAG: hypothetical protein RLZZ360_373 [Candidatus Parcubacteria bacterium]|jgi:adenine-specific DNA-methyltransferase
MKKVTHEDGQSANIIAENIAKLKALFPDAFTEGGMNIDVLRQLLGDAKVLDEGEEKYGLTWHGKKQARQIALTPSTGTLVPRKDESVDWATTRNVFIEGDNLESLKLLQKSYAGKARMIFIDPPYNTGNEFIYPDRFQDNLETYLKYTGQIASDGMKFSSNMETGGRLHTNWLNMMYPRIRLARTLLSDEGVIFVTIDDTEQANLRKICDEIFGEENFIANVVWQKKYTRANDAKWFSSNHDHVLCYAKNKDSFVLNQLPRTEDQVSAYKNPDGHPKGPWKATPLHAKSGTNNSSYTFKNGVTWTPPAGTYRRFNDASMKMMDEGDEIWFGEKGDQTPSRKSFLSEIKDGVTPTTLWPYDEVGHNHESNSELKALGMAGMFDNPKPTRLIRRMIQLSQSDSKDDLIIDFFAGSSTTAHAVLSANAEDGGTRRFIQIQLPEEIDKSSVAGAAGYENIAKLSAERIRRAGKTMQGKVKDLGFRYFQLNRSGIKAWTPDRNDMEGALLLNKDHLVEGRSEADILCELLLKRGIELTAPIEERKVAGKSVYSVGYGVLFACLDTSVEATLVDSLAQGILDWHRELEPETDSHVFFRDSAFADDIAKTNMVAILEQNGISHVRSL